MRGDYMGQCNPGMKIAESEFVSAICAQCANPGCLRSRYEDDATQKKINRHEKLMEFKDAEQAPLSPLGVDPEEIIEDGQVDVVINRAEPPTTVEDATGIDSSIRDLKAHKAEPVAPPAPAPTRRDPWAAPTRSPMDLYKEYDDPTQDPWSPKFQGQIHKKVAPGATVKMRGKVK